MSAFAPLTLNTEVYNPQDMNAGVTRWVNKDAGVATGFSPATLQVKSPSNGSRNYKVTGKLLVPIVETVGTAAPIGTFLRQIAAEFTVTIPDTALAAERADFALRLKDYVAESEIQLAISNLEPVSD